MPVTPPPYPRFGEPLSISWARQLIDWIRDSVAPRGDNSTCKVDGNVVTAFIPDVEYEGPFKVSLKTDGETTTADVAGGMIFFNRIFVPECPEKKSISVQEGFFCIRAEQDGENSVLVDYEIKNSIDGFPVMENEEDSPVAYYPIAKITQSDDDGSWTVEQIVRYQIPHLWAFGPCSGEEETN